MAVANRFLLAGAFSLPLSYSVFVTTLRISIAFGKLVVDLLIYIC